MSTGNVGVTGPPAPQCQHHGGHGRHRAVQHARRQKSCESGKRYHVTSHEAAKPGGPAAPPGGTSHTGMALTLTAKNRSTPQQSRHVFSKRVFLSHCTTDALTSLIGEERCGEEEGGKEDPGCGESKEGQGGKTGSHGLYRGVTTAKGSRPVTSWSEL